MAFEGQEEPFSRLALAVASHRRALHIPVQILAGKFKMEVLPTISLTKVFPVAQICPNLHKIVPSSKANPYLIIEWGGGCCRTWGHLGSGPRCGF